jgi:hypothetical protein
VWAGLMATFLGLASHWWQEENSDWQIIEHAPGQMHDNMQVSWIRTMTSMTMTGNKKGFLLLLLLLLLFCVALFCFFICGEGKCVVRCLVYRTPFLLPYPKRAWRMTGSDVCLGVMTVFSGYSSTLRRSPVLCFPKQKRISLWENQGGDILNKGGREAFT